MCYEFTDNLEQITNALLSAYPTASSFRDFVIHSWNYKEFQNISQGSLSDMVLELVVRKHSQSQCDDLIIAAHERNSTNGGLQEMAIEPIKRRIDKIVVALREGEHYITQHNMQELYRNLKNLVQSSLSDNATTLGNPAQLPDQLFLNKIYFKRDIYQNANKVLELIQLLESSGSIISAPSSGGTLQAVDMAKYLSAIKIHTEQARSWKMLHEEYQQVCVKVAKVNSTISNVRFPADDLNISFQTFVTAWGTDIYTLVDEQKALNGLENSSVRDLVEACLRENLWQEEMNVSVNAIIRQINGGKKDISTWPLRMPKVKHYLADLEFMSCQFLDWVDQQLKSAIMELERNLKQAFSLLPPGTEGHP